MSQRSPGLTAHPSSSRIVFVTLSSLPGELPSHLFPPGTLFPKRGFQVRGKKANPGKIWVCDLHLSSVLKFGPQGGTREQTCPSPW